MNTCIYYCFIPSVFWIFSDGVKLIVFVQMHKLSDLRIYDFFSLRN